LTSLLIEGGRKQTNTCTTGLQYCTVQKEEEEEEELCLLGFYYHFLVC